MCHLPRMLVYRPQQYGSMRIFSKRSLFIFRVARYHTRIARSLRKEAMIYFFDTGLVVGDEGARFENFVMITIFFCKFSFHAHYWAEMFPPVFSICIEV